MSLEQLEGMFGGVKKEKMAEEEGLGSEVSSLVK